MTKEQLKQAFNKAIARHWLRKSDTSAYYETFIDDLYWEIEKHTDIRKSEISGEEIDEIREEYEKMKKEAKPNK